MSKKYKPDEKPLLATYREVELNVGRPSLHWDFFVAAPFRSYCWGTITLAIWNRNDPDVEFTFDFLAQINKETEIIEEFFLGDDQRVDALGEVLSKVTGETYDKLHEDHVGDAFAFADEACGHWRGYCINPHKRIAA